MFDVSWCVLTNYAQPASPVLCQLHRRDQCDWRLSESSRGSRASAEVNNVPSWEAKHRHVHLQYSLHPNELTFGKNNRVRCHLKKRRENPVSEKMIRWGRKFGGLVFFQWFLVSFQGALPSRLAKTEPLIEGGVQALASSHSMYLSRLTHPSPKRQLVKHMILWCSEILRSMSVSSHVVILPRLMFRVEPWNPSKRFS